MPDELQDDVDSRIGCWQTFRFFLKHSYRDIKRRKCHFCLALCSVLIVVLSSLVVNTITSKGPIIFLKLAQKDSGEIDAVYSPNNAWYGDEYSWQWLNYTQAVSALDANDVSHNLSPRFLLCPHDDFMQVNNTMGR